MARPRTPSRLQAQAVRLLLRDAAAKLKQAGIDTPVLDAEVMLARALDRSRTFLLAHPDFEPPCEAVEKFIGWVSRRSQREPLAYIIGEREFYGISFEVTPAVLVPRPETETLVETAMGLLEGIIRPIVAEIGVGSGAVAISIAKAVPDVLVYATEPSASALEVARRNVERVGVSDRVRLLEGDLFEPLAGLSFDLIISNPPYIPSDEIDDLQPEIAKYEPRQALDGGPDGLKYFRRLSADAPRHLKTRAVLAVEVGDGQAAAVKELFQARGLVGVHSVHDYGGIERVVLGERQG